MVVKVFKGFLDLALRFIAPRPQKEIKSAKVIMLDRQKFLVIRIQGGSNQAQGSECVR
jgi:hypothetical protein